MLFNTLLYTYAFSTQVKYPEFKPANVVDTIHGYKIADPFRWLENPDSAETKKFVAEQNLLTDQFFKQSDVRQRFFQKMKLYTGITSRSVPFKMPNGYYFYQRDVGKQQFDIYYLGAPNGKPQLFLDANKLSRDGKTSLGTIIASKNGKFMAYSVSQAGSDWETIWVRSTELNKPNSIDVPVQDATFGIFQWGPDNLGYFYVRYPSTNRPTGTQTESLGVGKLYYHFIGKPQTSDIPVLQDANDPGTLAIYFSHDDKYFIIKNMNGDRKVCDFQVWVKSTPRKLQCIDLPFGYAYVTNEGPVFWLQTEVDAPSSKIVKGDITKLNQGFVDVIPHNMGLVLSDVNRVDNNKLLVVAMKDVNTVMAVHDLYSGKELYKIPVPVGSDISVVPSFDEPGIFYKVSSFVTPSTIYRFDLKTRTQVVWDDIKISGLRLNELVTTQVFYESRDRTKIPMYIVHKKGIKLDGTNPTVLYGYGGFQVSQTPAFSAAVAAFIQHFNGVYAVANIRGGSEYGDRWWDAGRRMHKQNSFDDFQYAARHLISAKYTTPSKLAINGGSNGGLLVAVCANQAPELFGAVVAEVGVMDLARFHLFTAGRFWITDYGDPTVKEDFENAMKYSPLHNIKKNQQYPATLVMTADHDDRVVPLHSLKYLATLQALNRKTNLKPLLGKIAVKSGHTGSSADQVLEDDSSRFGFIAMTLGATWKE